MTLNLFHYLVKKAGLSTFLVVIALSGCRYDPESKVDGLSGKDSDYSITKIILTDSSLISNLKENYFKKIENGEISIFKDKLLTEKITFKEFLNEYNVNDTVQKYNEVTENLESVNLVRVFSWDNVENIALLTKFKTNSILIKGDVYAVSPQVQLYTKSGNHVGLYSPFWTSSHVFNTLSAK